jgi:hypothetical protein
VEHKSETSQQQQQQQQKRYKPPKQNNNNNRTEQSQATNPHVAGVSHDAGNAPEADAHT